MYNVPLRPLMLTLLASTCLVGQGQAQQPSGNVIKVDPAVNAAGPGGERLLELQGAVFMGDEIVASPNGLAQIRFIDDTKMVVGPNSRLRIDEFVFNPDNTAQKVTISAVKGVFRFISGNSPHEAYSLRTPTMTIGVRGTVIDINARGPDSSAVFVQGSGTLCDSGGACIAATADCVLHVAPIGGGFAQPTGLAFQQRMAVFFPFLDSQQSLDPAFRVDTTGCNSRSNGRPRLFENPRESGGTKGNGGGPPDNDNGGGYSGGA
jgi:hypothetical protein